MCSTPPPSGSRSQKQPPGLASSERWRASWEKVCAGSHQPPTRAVSAAYTFAGDAWFVAVVRTTKPVAVVSTTSPRNGPARIANRIAKVTTFARITRFLSNPSRRSARSASSLPPHCPFPVRVTRGTRLAVVNHRVRRRVRLTCIDVGLQLWQHFAAELRGLMLHQHQEVLRRLHTDHVVGWHAVAIEDRFERTGDSTVRGQHFLQIESLFLTDRLVVSEQA